MPAIKPSRPPAFDAKTFSDRLHERVLTTAGKPYSIFRTLAADGSLIGFPRYINWVRSLRDAVNANAIYLDEVKSDLDRHKATDNARHAVIEERLSALEASGGRPFPA